MRYFESSLIFQTYNNARTSYPNFQFYKSQHANLPNIKLNIHIRTMPSKNSPQIRTTTTDPRKRSSSCTHAQIPRSSGIFPLHLQRRDSTRQMKLCRKLSPADRDLTQNFLRGGQPIIPTRVTPPSPEQKFHLRFPRGPIVRNGDFTCAYSLTIIHSS